MTEVETAHEHLQHAGDLAAVVAAAHQAFVAMLTALRAHEDPGSVWFGGFVMAAASAADGRDALLFAPSMQAHHSPVSQFAADETRSGTTGSIARDVRRLSGIATVRLTQAATEAAEPGDRIACQQAARCARRIGELLAEGET